MSKFLNRELVLTNRRCIFTGLGIFMYGIFVGIIIESL